MTQSTVRAPAPTPGHLPSPPVCWNETKFTRSYFKTSNVNLIVVHCKKTFENMLFDHLSIVWTCDISRWWQRVVCHICLYMMCLWQCFVRNQNVGNVWCQLLWWQNMCSGKIPGSVPEKWSEHVAWMRNSHNLQPFYETVKVAKTDIEGNLSVLVEGLWGLVSINSCSTCLIYMHNSTLHINAY